MIDTLNTLQKSGVTKMKNEMVNVFFTKKNSFVS
jgi:hypothetical protein